MNIELNLPTEYKEPLYPKYMKDFINLACGYSQSVRPSVIGQLSNILPSSKCKDYNSWKNYYISNYADKLLLAKNKCYEQIIKMGLDKIVDKTYSDIYIEDLIFRKTIEGLYIEDLILKSIAYICLSQNFRHSQTKHEESIGHDIFINNIPLSIKPVSYKSKIINNNELIQAYIIYYKKNKDNLIFTIDDNILQTIKEVK